MINEIASHTETFPAGSFDRVETDNRPAIAMRKRSKATPGNPAGNMENSRCI